MEKKSVCDEKNFESIFDDCSESLRNLIYYKCGDIDLAEDIIQDAFIKLWNNCKKVVFYKAKSYLYTVANNNLLNHIAHKKVVLRYEQRPHSDLNNQDPQFIIEEKEFMSKLNNAIDSLPEKQRETFLLSRIDKKSYKEIAEITGVSVKAIEKRIHYALLSLRQKLGDIL
ncbi:RNA polymerase sigma-70 factor, ECF subfamily [Aquimarina amphilecti]|uniref:RNA polymerase sigma-70 factor, ECF subfamily n=1 Tax=Aquimarina amphilecti TaxID=1038014 RepID=A0A1H7UHR1_AQUAM|nr:sigma-70 family RNA polymerase sigma factor [Aquimarina amphilecti]SEL96284.1 RNA polymerase sigma-70 factor, ECF subfamily [Aquimarina amphilecti]